MKLRCLFIFFPLTFNNDSTSLTSGCYLKTLKWKMTLKNEWRFYDRTSPIFQIKKKKELILVTSSHSGRKIKTTYLILEGTKQWYHQMGSRPLIEQLEILIHLMACMSSPTKTHELHSWGPKWLSKIMRGCNGGITWSMCCSTSKEVCHPKICKHRPYFSVLM